MDAIGRVDLQSPATIVVALAVIDHLVHAGRAELLAGVAELARAAIRAHAGIENLQVRGLLLVVGGGGEEDGSQPVTRRESSFDILSGGLGSIEMLQTGEVGNRVVQRPRRMSAGNDFQRRVGHAEPQAALEPRLEVAHGLQLLAAR